MNNKYLVSLIAVLVLVLLPYVGVEALNLQLLFGYIIPLLALAVFLILFTVRVLTWARSAVPFRIPTTCGQQKSMPWIQQSKIENPSAVWAVVVRMALEILLFRSLFRNTRMAFHGKERISYKWEKWLWVASLAFHYAFFAVIVRHLRFFMEPVPLFVKIIERVDGFFKVEILYDVIQIGLPGVYLSGLVLLASVLFLLTRRILLPQVRYISLAADFFPLFLIIGIAFTGILMRHVTHADIAGIKSITMAWIAFQIPVFPETVTSVFYIHIFFVSTLLIYFPFSKLMHMAGIFFSPTRNMTANTREIHHDNPWNYPVKVHTYEAYEDEFREKMIEAGLPVEKE